MGYIGIQKLTFLMDIFFKQFYLLSGQISNANVWFPSPSRGSRAKSGDLKVSTFSKVTHLRYIYSSRIICIPSVFPFYLIKPRKLKPIFHWKLGSHWLPNANEINTKYMKCTLPTPEFCVGTQHNLYSTGLHLGFALGKTQL